MNWLDRIVDRWYWFLSKVGPVWDVIVKIFSTIGRIFALLWKYIFMFRGILLVAPVAAAAVLVASWAQQALPEAVEITHLVLDRSAEGAIFGLFVMRNDLITRDVAIAVPLAMTVACMIFTIFSKRTLYPWLISLLTLTLPIVMYFLNTYPM